MTKRHSVISLFSGGLGLDLGLEQAGFEIRVAVECNRFAAETIKRNRPDLPLLQRRIEDLTTHDILKAAKLKPGEVTVVTGGPSCQAFSTAGTRGSVSDPRGVMFREFLRVVREARPRFFIMENVRGVLSAAVKHRPLNKRGPGFPPLRPAEELGSALKVILKELESLGYHVVFDLVNAADYGIPQARERVLFIGSRDGEPIEIPRRTHAKKKTKGRLPWVSLRKGLAGLNDAEPEFSELCISKKNFLKRVPAGGNWKDLPTKMQRKALGRAYVSWGGRVGFFRRLSWSKPAPALTTRPDSKATMFCPLGLLLDEPTSGLDPVMEGVFRACIAEERHKGRTVLLSSHLLDEVEALCDRVTIIRDGKVVESGSLAELRHLPRTAIVVELAAPPVGLAELPGVHDVHVDGTRARLKVDASELDRVMRALTTFGLRSLVSQPPTLEELFLRHYAATR